MTEEKDRYSLPFVWVNVGFEVNLKDFGFDERFIVCKAYWGRPLPEDTLLGQCDLSNVDPRDERRNFSAEQLEDWRTEDMTLIVARKSGGQSIVIHIPDFDKEVEVYDDGFYDRWVKHPLDQTRVPN